MNNLITNRKLNPSQQARFLQEKSPNPSVGTQNLENPEIIEVKQKELFERAFTTFRLDDWDENQIDSLAELARKNSTKFIPYYQNTNECNSYNRDETDSYNANTTTIRRVFLTGSSEHGFKEIKTIRHPFPDDGSLMAHPLVNAVLSLIFKLIPKGEMRPERDRIEVSLIQQCASSMPKLDFHRDIKRQVFILILACNLKESDGAQMSIRDNNRVTDRNQLKVFPTQEDILFFEQRLQQPAPLPLVVKDVKYHYTNIPSHKGNGYLIRELTDATASAKQYVVHGRDAYFTEEKNPERISLRILIDDIEQPIIEAV